MFKRIVSILILTIFGAILLVNCKPAEPPFECTDAIGCVDIAPDEPIKIGALQALSGELAFAGLEFLQSIELAIADRDGELLGHPIELQTEDTLGSAEGGTTAALKIVADPQLVAIVGCTISVSTVTASKVMSKAGLVMVSGGPTAPSLTVVSGGQGADWQPGYFRTTPNDTMQGQAAATFAFQQLGVTKVATIDDGDPYTQGLTAVFTQEFTELGGEIVLATTVNKGDTNMRPMLTGVVMSGAKLVFFPILTPESSFIVLQAKELEGAEGITLMSADASLSSVFFETAGAAGVGMYFIKPGTPEGSAYDTFVSNYETKYGEVPIKTPFAPHVYDATNMVLSAIEAVAVQEKDGTLHIGRQTLREALAATSEYQGLTGSLTCDKFGDCGVPRYKVVRLDDPAAGLEGLVNNVVYSYTPEQ